MKDLKDFEIQQQARWTNMVPLIQQIKTVIKSFMSNPIDQLAGRVHTLEQNLSRDTNLKTPATAKRFNPPQDSFLDQLFQAELPEDKLHPNQALITNDVLNMQEDIKLLMSRTSGDGFKIRDFNFQSMDELKTWVEAHVVGNRFGLFVDGVSLWEYYRHGHFSMPEVLASMRDTSRVGFATVQEARVAASFENILPAVLGRGTDLTKSLPGLPNHSVWNAGDGTNGLRFHLNDYNTNVYTQLADQIQNTFDDFSSPARTLALECLQREIQFVNELVNYITRFHAELDNSRSFSKDQCCQLVSRCVKRCFQDLAAVRVTAKDGRLQSDPLGTASTYIWGTLRTHSVMQEYLKYNFEDHPAFASVITRFVTNNNFQANIKTLQDQVDKQDKETKSMSKRIDTIFNRLSVIEKKVP